VRSVRQLHDDERGAVYVEFLIVFLPLFVMFMSLVQLAFVEIANLVTKHAAVAACRAAIVVLPDNPSLYSKGEVNHAEGDRLDVIKAAAKARLLAVSVNPKVEVTFPSSAEGTDNKTSFNNGDTVRVQLAFDFPCRIPIGSRFVCNFLTLHKKLKAEAAMPLQSASYKYEDE
jgi:Flp pilus assembly protein TadG